MQIDALMEAFSLVFDPFVLLVIFGAAVFGLFVGAIPGLSAGMALALLVPITFFMDPVPAIGAIVSVTAMALFAGDIPAALLRMPGTAASAAYTDESYALAQKGQLDLALGVNLVFSALGGLFGVAFLIVAAPSLAEFALNFSTFEYFWLTALGLTTSVLITTENPIKGVASLLIGLSLGTVGLDPSAGFPRFTFGSVELMGGIHMIAAIIGMFALSEILRNAMSKQKPEQAAIQTTSNIFAGVWPVWKKYWTHFFRGSAIGTVIGALPGAGADIAAWVSYAVAKRFSKEPEKFGTGHIEGIVDATSANNSALAGAWIPATVFGIPGDSLTAIAISVLFMKGMNPGPTIFTHNPQFIYAIFIIFVLANIAMVPLGWVMIKFSKQVLRVPRDVLLPIILIFSIVGAFAMTNSVYAVSLMLATGVLGWLMEKNDFPVGPVILALVLGGIFEQNFMSSMFKSDGSLLAFFERPIAGTLGVLTLSIWAFMLVSGIRQGARQRAGRRLSRRPGAQAPSP